MEISFPLKVKTDGDLVSVPSVSLDRLSTSNLLVGSSVEVFMLCIK